MRIVLLDHHLTRRRPHRPVWKECLGRVLTDHEFYAVPDGIAPLSLPVQPDVLLLHTEPDTEDEWRAWHRQQSNTGTVVVVVSTTLRRRNPGQDGWYGCYWHPEEFDTVPQAQEFLKHLKHGRFVPELLWPRGAPADVLAYLLAEHYRLYDVGSAEMTRLRRAAEREFASISTQPNATDEEMKDWFRKQGF